MRLVDISCTKMYTFLQLVLNLDTAKTDPNGFFTFAGDNVEADRTWKISQTSVNLQSRKQVMGEDYLNDFIPDSDEAPHAVMLIRSDNDYHLPVITRERPYIKLNGDPPLMTYLQDSVVDMVVYGRYARTDRCQIFEDIYSEFQGKRYILREYDSAEGSLSLNRCEERQIIGFVPLKWQLGVPTPGRRNLCDSGFNPILEKHLDELQVERGEVETGTSESLANECAPRTNEPNIYSAVGSEDIDNLMETSQAASCPARDESMDISFPRGDDDIQDDLDLERLSTRLQDSFSLNDQVPEEEDYESTSYFDEGWKHLVETYQKVVMPVDVLEEREVQTWFMYVVNNVSYLLNTYYCRICEHFFSIMQFNENERPDIAKKTGHLEGGTERRSAVDANRATILGHVKTPIHQIIIRNLKLRKIARIRTMLGIAQKQSNEEVDFGPTLCLIRSAYFTFKVNLPFSSYNKLITLQILNKADCGTILHSRYAVVSAGALISKNIHIMLVEKIRRDNIPFALIADESTSKNQAKYMVLLIQTLESDIPVVYFYRSIEIQTVFTPAEKLLKYILNAFREDDLEEVMEKNMVSLASDGASVMKRLATLLDDITDTIFYPVHCFGHRIQLALNFIKEMTYHMDALKIFKKAHTYYGEPKKRNHYIKTGKAMRIKTLKLKTIQETRWLPSTLDTIKSFMKVFEVVYKDLELISVDKREFDAKARALAASFRKTIGHPRFLQYVSFFQDLAQPLTDWNLFVQRRNGVLFEQARKKTKVVQQIKDLQNAPGYHLRTFYESLVCTLANGTIYSKNSADGQCREDQMEIATEIRYKQNSILTAIDYEGNEQAGTEEQPADVPKTSGKRIHELVLKDVKATIIGELVAELESYFPRGETDAMSVFDINLFPTNRMDFLEYGADKVRIVARQLGYDVEVIVEEWEDLMTVFSQLAWMCDKNKRPSDSSMFWSDILRNSMEGINLGEHMIRFLRHLLSIPVGSSDAEASFSILKHIMPDRRSNLGSNSLEDSMRIRINAKDDLNEVDAIKFATEWLAEGHKRPDDLSQRQRGGRKVKEKYDHQKDRTERRFTGRSKMF